MERGACLLWLLLAGAAWGSDIVVEVTTGETIVLQRIPDGGEVLIDGNLDEPLWRTLPAYDKFVVIEPDTLSDPRHPTLVRLAYDDRGLYVGTEMRQPVGTLIKRLSSRDDRELNRDSINLTLDSSGTGRYGFWFGINLGDTLMDGTVLPERAFSSEWDGPWRGRSRETAAGWTAEFFIPWSTMSMPSAGANRRMGLYMSRKVAYLDERWGWPALPDTIPRFMSALQGLEMARVAPRQQYNFYPFLAVTDDRIDDEVGYRLGADVFWRPSTNFQLNATVNPDFDNVESDEVVINLTATETYFPEQRLFFLEGQEIFIATPRADTRGTGIGNSGAPYTMVYTRRIGGPPELPALPPQVTIPDRELYQPVELLGAAKVTGQSGRLRYGALAALEDDLKFDLVLAGQPRNVHQDGSDYGVARLLYEDNADGVYRALGVLATAAVHPQGDALAHGIDGHYLSGEGQWKWDGQVMTSHIDGVGRGYGGFVDMEYTFRRGMQQRLGVEYFDEQFDINDVGFLERNDRYRIRSSFILTESDLGWARNNQFDVRGFLQNNVSEDLFTGGGIFFSDRVMLNNLSQVTARAHYLPEQYDDLNSFGNGTYRIEERTEAFLYWDSNTTRRISYGGGGGHFEEHLGDPGWMAEAWFAWRPVDRFSVRLNAEYRRRHGWLLHQGGDLMATFDADQWQPGLTVDYFVSARQQIRVGFQWVGIKAREREFFRIPADPGDLVAIDKPTGPGSRDSYDFSVSQYSFQARYRWEFAPLSDVYLVYTRQTDLGAALMDESWREVFRESWDRPLQDAMVFKIRYRLGS